MLTLSKISARFSSMLLGSCESFSTTLGNSSLRHDCGNQTCIISWHHTADNYCKALIRYYLQ